MEFLAVLFLVYVLLAAVIVGAGWLVVRVIRRVAGVISPSMLMLMAAVCGIAASPQVAVRHGGVGFVPLLFGFLDGGASISFTGLMLSPVTTYVAYRCFRSDAR